MNRSAAGVVVDFAELSDPGRDPTKQINEDASAYAETPYGHLAVVCDGMGGHAGGRAAAEAALGTIIDVVSSAKAGVELHRKLLASAVEAASRAVYSLGGDAPSHVRPGSTCVAVLIHSAGATIAHVGDSRAYLMRAGSIQRLTRDHSMVQQMVEAGFVDAQRAAQHPDANKLTRALGMHAEVEVEISEITLRPSDVILLASDGLTDLIADDELLGVVQSTISSGPALGCQKLVELANARGGHDNVTVQLIRIVDAPAPHKAALPTVLDAGDRARPAPAATLVDSTRNPDVTLPEGMAPAMTLADSVHGGARSTEPDFAAHPVASVPTALGARTRSIPPHAPVPRARLFFLALAIAILFVVVITVWWLFAPRRGRHVEPDPAPAVVSAAAPPELILEAAAPAAPSSSPPVVPVRDAHHSVLDR